MKKQLFFVLMVGCAASLWAAGTTEATLTVDAAHPSGTVSPLFYGLMTEEINHSYDGGLYAELVQNRAFLDSATAPVHWSVVEEEGSGATIALDPNRPLDRAIPTSLKLDVTKASADHPAGFANDGYWGIPVKPDTEYRASFYAKAAPGFDGSVTVSIQSDDGGTIYARGEVAGLSQGWKRYDVTLTTGELTETTKARYVLTTDRPGEVWFSIVSLFPPTFDNQPNGFRPDIMKMLIALHPKFLRFPGGNYLEGNTIADRFDWKKTIGPLKDRPGHEGPWGYRSSDGLGLLEFLLWCRDMHAEPVLAVYAGYSLDGKHVAPGKELEPFVRSALDEIEYVTGPVTSKWGAIRAQDGYPAPFPLHYVEIGNEDFFDQSGSYNARFTQFYDAIKAKYPNIQIISTIGTNEPSYQRVSSVMPDVLDEHYYEWYLWFIVHAQNHFKDYHRSGPKIMVGEWASYETTFPPWSAQSRQEPPTPDMAAALGDAAWTTAMERNSDLVIMNAYAPLLVNVNPGARQWRPDLIGFNGLHVFGSPSYYAIEMFSSNLGNEILPMAFRKSKIQGSATLDSRTGEIYLHLVNPEDSPSKIHIVLAGLSSVRPTATAITLAAKPDATNSITERRNVVPVTTAVQGVGPSFTYDMPADAVVVLRIATR